MSELMMTREETKRALLQKWSDTSVPVADLAAEQITKLEAENKRLREALTRINRRASPNPERTFDMASFDLMWITDEARAALEQS